MSFYSEELAKMNVPLDIPKWKKTKQGIENQLCALESEMQKLPPKYFRRAMKHIHKIGKIVRKGCKELSRRKPL